MVMVDTPARHAAGYATTLIRLHVRIWILTENLTIHIFTYDHSDLVCNHIPTSIIYSLTYPDAGIRAPTLPIDNGPGAATPEDTPDKETIDH